MPSRSPGPRWALTPPFHPCPGPKPWAVCFLWRCPWGRPRRALPAASSSWSPDFPPPRRSARATARPSGPLRKVAARYAKVKRDSAPGRHGGRFRQRRPYLHRSLRSAAPDAGLWREAVRSRDRAVAGVKTREPRTARETRTGRRLACAQAAAASVLRPPFSHRSLRRSPRQDARRAKCTSQPSRGVPAMTIPLKYRIRICAPRRAPQAAQDRLTPPV